MFKKLDINTPLDLMNWFKDNLNYGFVYRNKAFTDMEPNFQKNIAMYKTSKITKRLDAFEFIEHCLKGQKVEILNERIFYK